jgi:asparagine synthase (glutamine-hydrolysing)
VSASLGIRSERLARALPALMERDDVAHFCKVYEVFSDEQILGLMGLHDSRSEQRVAYFYDQLRCPERTDAAARMMTLDLRMNLADDLLLYSDKVTMHHSLECRVPLLDLDLVHFIESLPTRYRVRLGTGKLIHKQVARRLLPRQIVDRPKKGFLVPTRHWFRDSSVVRDLLLDGTSRFSTFFNRRAVAQVLDEHNHGFNRERQIFLLLGIHFWLQEFAD